MEENGATLEVGFVIDTGGSFSELQQLQEIMNSTEYKTVQSAKTIEQATKGMVNLAGATASMTAFGNAATREAQNAARELAKVEKAGESLSRQLDRQASTFGKTAAEIRATKVETAALAAEQQGLTELAGRLRSQEAALFAAEFAAARQARFEAEAAAEAKQQASDQAAAAANAEAEAVRRAADAYRMFEAVARQKSAAYRDGQAAAAAEVREAENLANAAARLRASIDPAFAAQQRFDNEMKQARVLIAAGAISLDDYSAKLRLEQAILRDSTNAHNNMAGAIGKNSFALRQMVIQLPDIVQGILSGQHLSQVAIQQGGQMVQIAMMAEGGLKGMVSQLAALAATAAPVAIVAGAVALGTAAWLSYSSAVDHMSAIAQGAGRLLGMTGSDLEASAEAAARAGNMTVGAARDIQSALVGVGDIGGEALTRATVLTKDFAAATGVDAAAAAKQLGAALNDPIAGSQDLTEKYGVLNTAQIEQISTLIEQNDKLGAQRVLLNALEPAFDGAADHANILARGWNNIATAASSAWTWMGKALDRMATGGGLQDQLEALTSRRATMAVALGNRLTGQPNDMLADLDKQIADIRYKMRQEANFNAFAQTNATQAKAMQIVNSYTGGNRLDDYRKAAGDLRAGLATDMPPEQRKQMTEALGAYTHAIETFIPAQQKANQLAALDAQIARTKAGPARAALATQRAQIASAGEVITAADAQTRATDRGTAALGRAHTARNTHAQTLAREAEAMVAQTRNLYVLADAYGVSGAAALIAEARVKAESQAIRQRGDVDAAVARQIRLAIAQRVADAAKSTAATREQAAATERVNALVAQGLVPAARAAEMVKDQIADLPLLAAIEAAQQQGLAEEANRATKALADQRAERERLNKAEDAQRFNADITGGANRLAELREELRLVGATQEVRERALATLRATQEAQKFQDSEHQTKHILQQLEIVDATQRLAAAQRDWNDALTFTADKWDLIARNVQNASQGMAEAFGGVGRAIGDMATAYAAYRAQEERAAAEHKIAMLGAATEAAKQREMAKYGLATSTAQAGVYGDMAAAAKGFFKEGTAGYQAMQRAEQVFRAIQFALSVRAMAQNAAETASSIAKSGLRTAAHAVEAVVKAISSLPFPLNLVAGAATAAAIASLGVSIAHSFGGSGAKPAESNTGTGTVLGDAAAQSASLKNAIDSLKQVDTLTNSYAREMSTSLKSIDSQIAGFAAVLVRTGNINASAGVTEGFKMDTTGKILSNLINPGGVLSKIPVIGGIIGGISKLVGSLFGSTTKVTGSGLYGGAQSIGSILGGGFNAQYFSDIDKAHKFLGITTGHSYSTQYGAADPALANQFTLILKSFDQAILAAAGPLGEATSTIETRLNGFVVNLGKIDLQGLTGEQIQEKLSAIFGAAADGMAAAAFPGIEQFQKVGEGAFETLVRVASTLEAVSGSLDMLGASAQGMSAAAKLALADQFDSVSAFNDAANSYFQTYYSKEEQAAAKTAQLAKVFESLGLTMPSSLAGFRQLVEAQDLTTAAGQSTYAMLLKLAPAFADLQSALAGAKSAADILSERQDLERQLLELQGNTEAIRQLDLAKLDESNRALQLQIWAIQDAQEAAKAADELRQAWQSVGDSIMDEVKRIRGLSDGTGATGFATLLGQFNAANAAARGGDMDAAKNLPQLSQALLAAAANAATSRQELDRIQAQTAAALEATYLLIHGGTGTAATLTNAALLNAGAASQPATASVNDNIADTLSTKLDALYDKVEQMRSENTAGHAANASNTGKMAKTLDNVTSQSGGDAISTVQAA